MIKTISHNFLIEIQYKNNKWIGIVCKRKFHLIFPYSNQIQLFTANSFYINQTWCTNYQFSTTVQYKFHTMEFRSSFCSTWTLIVASVAIKMTRFDLFADKIWDLMWFEWGKTCHINSPDEHSIANRSFFIKKSASVPHGCRLNTHFGRSNQNDNYYLQCSLISGLNLIIKSEEKNGNKKTHTFPESMNGHQLINVVF